MHTCCATHCSLPFPLAQRRSIYSCIYSVLSGTFLSATFSVVAMYCPGSVDPVVERILTPDAASTLSRLAYTPLRVLFCIFHQGIYLWMHARSAEAHPASSPSDSSIRNWRACIEQNFHACELTRGMPTEVSGRVLMVRVV